MNRLSKEEYAKKENEVFSYAIKNNIKVINTKEGKTYEFNFNGKEYVFSTCIIQNKKSNVLYHYGNLTETIDFFEDCKFISNVDAYFEDYLKEVSEYEDPKKAFTCLNPEHDDNHPSMFYSPNKNICHCFACNKTYNIVSLAMQREKLHYLEAIHFLRLKYNGKEISNERQAAFNENTFKDSESILNNVISFNENQYAINYLNRNRGIRSAHSLLEDVRCTNKRIYFLLKGFQGNYVSYQSRSLNNEDTIRYKKMPSAKAGIFNPLMKKGISQLNDGKENFVFLFEGEIDCLTFIDLFNSSIKIQDKEINNIYPIALSSINNIHAFIKQLDEAKITDNVNFFVAFDHDEAGMNASKEISTLLSNKNYNVKECSLFFNPEYKDLNELNVSDRASAFKSVLNTYIHLNKYYFNNKSIDSDYKEEMTARKVFYKDKMLFSQMYGLHYLNELKARESISSSNSFNKIDSTIYYSNQRQVASSCLYPNKLIDNSIEGIKKAFSKDYVCGEYIDNYRNNKNFVKSNILPIDIDNDHSDKEEDWISQEDIKFLFKDCSFIIHNSRNNMKEKHGQSPRPRFHVLFALDEINDSKAYSELKTNLYDIFPYIDKNAVDASRFFFGTENPEIEIHNGTIPLNKWIDEFNKKIYQKKIIENEEVKFEKKKVERGLEM